MDINQLQPIELNNPFLKEKIVAIDVWAGVDMVGVWQARGYIMFQDKLTNGRQDFEGRTFDEVVNKMKTFLNNLQ